VAITEQEFRRQLDAAAVLARPPRFTMDDLTRRIRSRRRRIRLGVSAGIATIAAMAIAFPLGLSGGPAGHPGTNQEGMSVPAPVMRSLRFEVTVNGQRAVNLPTRHPKGCGTTPANPCPAPLGAGFTVSPGEHLNMRVMVTIPVRARLSGLWLGISSGTFGSSNDGAPVGLRPILVQDRRDLAPGQHLFRLAWTVPATARPGAVNWLAFSWDGSMPRAGAAGAHEPGESASVSGKIDALVVRR
jgi:hypothetical protein